MVNFDSHAESVLMGKITQSVKRCRDGALLLASSLPCLRSFWHAIPTPRIGLPQQYNSATTVRRA